MLSRSLRLGIVLLSLAGNAVAQINRDAPRFTPTMDGSITAEEMAGQLEVSLVWPIPTGALLLEGSGSSEADLSAEIYLSWDETNLHISAFVSDDTPDFRLFSGGTGNVPYNAQDTLQPTFNPFNDPDNFFQDPAIPAEVDPGEFIASIYDIVVNTSDDFGPDIYRRPPLMDADQHEAVVVTGQVTDTGYVLETALPWAVAMDDADPNYVPKDGDIHGLSFILLSFNGEDGATPDIATLMTDFGDGINTIPDPTTWNTMTLVGPTAQPGDFNADGQLDAADIDSMVMEIQQPTGNLLFDVNNDGAVDLSDHTVWIKELRNAWVGDANFDGEFNSGDLIVVLSAGKYETNDEAGWGQGDWNGDKLFNSSDLVAALSDGGYELGPRPPAAFAVPEPVAGLLAWIGALAMISAHRR